MSFFGNLRKVPKATTGQYVNISGLPQYSYKTLVDKEEIGIGGFAVVFTAKLPENDRTFVVKKLLDSSHEGRQSLVKEARLLSKLHHVNVVQFKGIFVDQYALILEHVQFDFAPIGYDIKVNSLSENKCISSKQPYFHPSIVTVPHWVQSQLTATHISYLRQCGVRI